MNIQDIKNQVKTVTSAEVGTIMFVRQMDQEDDTKPTEWVSHWDNANRIRITAHEEVLAKMKEDSTRKDLAVKYEFVPKNEDREAYHRFVVILPKHVEAAF